MEQKIKILIADDHVILLDGIKSLLLNHKKYEVVNTAVSAPDALEKLKESEIDLIITDLSMPGMDGFKLIETIRRKHPLVKIVVLSLHDESYYVQHIMKQEVQGYIHKSETMKELLTALDLVADDKTFISSRINQVLIESLKNKDKEPFLTSREIQILKLITQEFTNNEIADKLFISPRTVETHRKNIFRKTGCNSLVGLIKFAYDNNIIEK